MPGPVLELTLPNDDQVAVGVTGDERVVLRVSGVGVDP